MSRWTLPAVHYKSQKTFNAEMKDIFQKAWILYGPTAGRLERPGNQWAQTIIPSLPMIALQTKGGNANLFMNVCKHRAGPLQYDGTFHEGNGNDILMCKYHKWCYNKEGRLTATPNYGDKELDLSQFRLDKIQSEETSSLLFFRMNEGPLLKDSFGNLWDRLKRFDLGSYRLLGNRSHNMRANWKTYAENYLEGYHIPAIHPTLNASLDINKYQGSILCNNFAVIPFPEGDYVEHLQGGGSDSQYLGLWLYVWPNLALNFYKAGLSVEQIIPHSPTETEIRYTFLTTREADQVEQHELQQWSKVVTEEDVKICEATQRGLESGAYTRGLLSPKHEGGVQFFQERWRKTMPKEIVQSEENLET